LTVDRERHGVPTTRYEVSIVESIDRTTTAFCFLSMIVFLFQCYLGQRELKLLSVKSGFEFEMSSSDNTYVRELKQSRHLSGFRF